jgi:hypothetical protein
MAKPILYSKFNGLWKRGPVDDTPPDHFSDCLNNTYVDAGVCMRDGLSAYIDIQNIVYTALYKPNPPFTGTNVPRMIALNNVGELFDVLISTTVPIYTNINMTFFGFTNFFGRCYISPSNGRTGLDNEFVKMYDGTTFRNAGGTSPTIPLLGTASAGGRLDVGTYLISYAFETSSGFVTRPATPFVGFDSFGGYKYDITTLPLGPVGTVARWIIVSKSNPLLSLGPLGGPYQVDKAEFIPLYLFARIANNIDTTYEVSFFDEQLINEANFLFTQLTTIPAGVGLLDINGRLGSYGEFDDPSLFRVSEPGEPEAFDETSGFIITDPTDNTGVRAAIEFRKTLQFYKQNRGYLTEDNGNKPSTWQVIPYEKSIGTEQNGIADILDAKGSSSEGFILASQGAAHFFNGVFLEPELTYKIRDLWLTINKANFYKLQAVNDPINKRIYFLVPFDDATEISHIIYGDYRNGLNANSIKWSLWQFDEPPTSLLVYTNFDGDTPSLVTRLSFESNLRTLNINTPGNDDGAAVTSYAKLAPARFSSGVSHFGLVRARVQGPCTLALTLFGQDDTISENLASITTGALPGREYAQLANLISEYGQLKFTVSTLNEKYKINTIIIEGEEYSYERPRV